MSGPLFPCFLCVKVIHTQFKPTRGTHFEIVYNLLILTDYGIILKIILNFAQQTLIIGCPKIEKY